MHLKILFFGQLTDITQTTQMDLNVFVSTAFELDAFLKKNFLILKIINTKLLSIKK